MQVGVDIGSYTFNAVAKTITFVGVGLTSIEQIKPIINGNANIDIFNPLTTGKFGSLTGQVLTLDFNTGSQNNSDKLYICVNLVDEQLSLEATQLLVKSVLETIKTDTNLLSKEDTQLLIKAVLDTIKTDAGLLVGKDFATETTIQSIESEIQNLNSGAPSKLNQYNQIELLNLMYEELQQINKTLKKIYQ